MNIEKTTNVYLDMEDIVCLIHEIGLDYFRDVIDNFYFKDNKNYDRKDFTRLEDCRVDGDHIKLTFEA
jgi:hypothetical protein